MTAPGTGLIIVDVLLVITCAVAALLQIAVLRDNSIPEHRLIEAARAILATGYTILAVRFTFLLATDGDLYIPGITEMALVMIAFGHICFGWVRIKVPPAH